MTMARFVFKLSGVLKQRKHEEQSRQRDLAERQAQLAALAMSLQRLNDSVAASNDDLRSNRLTGALDMSFLGAHRRFVLAMRQQAIELLQKLALAQRHVDEANARLAEAAKRRKAIEKLREKQFAQWRAEMDRKEMIDLDEIGMQIAHHELQLSDAAVGNQGGAAR
jgi:flagellar FliJ protein